MKAITNGHGVMKSITRAEYRSGDWECVGEDDYTGRILCYSRKWRAYRVLDDAGDRSISFTAAKDHILDMFDMMYKNLKLGTSRHVEIRSIYADLAGRWPDAWMADCFDIVQDICMFCASPESVYPYPDGEKWTEEEIARYHRWQTVRNWRDEE